MISNSEKQTICDALREKIDLLGISNNEASKRIKVSAATISNMLNGKWDSITDAWLKVKDFVQERVSGWQAVETANFKLVQKWCEDAQKDGASRAISFHPGTGKTFSVKYYADTHKNCFYVAAVGDMNKRQLLQALCHAMGLGSSYQLGDMLDNIIDKLNHTANPLIIIDEFDEVDNRAMRVFKDLYNRCNCGFMLVGGRHLEERIKKGVSKNKQSYAEIYSRIGGEFLTLKPITLNTIESICKANGVYDKNQIVEISKEAKGDLRRVEALVKTVLLTTKN